MNKTVTKIKNKIQEKPLETAMVVLVATATASALYYNRSTMLKFPKSDRKKLDLVPNSSLLFEIKGQVYALTKVNHYR